MATAVQHNGTGSQPDQGAARSGRRELTGLRLKVVGGGCSGLQYKMDLDNPKPTDRVFEEEGAKVIVDLKSLLYLGGTELDYKESPHGSRLRLSEPQRQAQLRLRRLVRGLRPASPGGARRLVGAGSNPPVAGLYEMQR